MDMGEEFKLLDLARNLIRLAGDVPDDDIAIEFVGLRPWEKLSERLTGEGEWLEPGQYFIAPGWIFGYTNSGAVSGTLINRNHFAGLLEMLIPVAFGLAYIAARRHRDTARAYVYLAAGRSWRWR